MKKICFGTAGKAWKGGLKGRTYLYCHYTWVPPPPPPDSNQGWCKVRGLKKIHWAQQLVIIQVRICSWLVFIFLSLNLTHLREHISPNLSAWQITSSFVCICFIAKFVDWIMFLRRCLKPKYRYSFGKWWKLKISLMGIVHKSFRSSQSPVNLFVRNHQFS